MRGDFFREGGFNKIRGVLDPQGKLIGWDEHLIRADYPGKPGFLTGPWPSAFPFNSVDNVRASLSTFRVDTPTGAWRAPYSNTPTLLYLKASSMSLQQQLIEITSSFY